MNKSKIEDEYKRDFNRDERKLQLLYEGHQEPVWFKAIMVRSDCFLPKKLSAKCQQTRHIRIHERCIPVTVMTHLKLKGEFKMVARATGEDTVVVTTGEGREVN